MSRAAEALKEILVKSSDVDHLDSSILGELDRWLDDACEEVGNSQNVAGIMDTCNRIYQEKFASRLIPNLVVAPHAFDGLSLSVTRQRCIGLILATPAADPSTKIGRGAERIFDYMEAAGCFPEFFE
jgi:hypothetical protein